MLYGVVFHVKQWYNGGYETLVRQKIKRPDLFRPAGNQERQKDYYKKHRKDRQAFGTSEDNRRPSLLCQGAGR